MGRIEEASFGDAANRFGWTQRALALRVLAVHHHLVLTEDLEPAAGYLRGFGIAVDAARIQRMAAKFGVQLALHGHKHRAFIWRSSVYELPEFAQQQHRLGELSIVGGGSAGSKDTIAASNYFNVLHVGTDGLTLKIWRSQNRGLFDAFQIWNASLTIDSDDGLLLGNWRPTA